MRRLSFLLAVVFAASPLLCRAADPMAQHRAFAGWSSADSLSWHATGTRSEGGQVLALSEAHRGILVRDTTQNPQGISLADGFNGRLAWSSDENGFSAVELGRRAQAAIALDILRSESVADLHPSVSGRTTYGGRSATILQIQPNGLPPIQILEDDASGAFVRAVVAPNAPDQQIFEDLQYTQIGSRRFLSSWHAPDGAYSLTTFDLTSAVSDADLQPPVPDAQWSFGQESVPFYLVTQSDNARIVRVAASVNGRTGIFTLSTGTPGIVLYADFARSANVRDVGVLPGSPFLGNVNFEGLSRVNELRVGDSVLHGVVVSRMTSPANELAGILGYDFFAGAIVNVDLRGEHLALADPKTSASPGPSGYSFPLDLSSRVPVIAMQLPQGEMHPEIDTALPGFIIASQALRDSGRLSGHDISSQAAVGFGGQGASGDPIASLGLDITYTDWHATSTTGRCISAEDLFVGPYKYANPPVCFGGTNVFGTDGGVIGLDFLRHFNWSIDYPHARFAVTPNGE
jgi:hypothetical protein